jgi:hypothetical protein
MQHHAHAHPGADVRRAGREIAEPFVEGVGDLRFDEVVDLVDLLPGGVQIESRLEHLNPEVILLVHHQADLLVVVDCDEVSDSQFESEWLDPLIGGNPRADSSERWLEQARGGTIVLRSVEKMTDRKQSALFRHFDIHYGSQRGRHSALGGSQVQLQLSVRSRSPRLDVYWFFPAK